MRTVPGLIDDINARARDLRSAVSATARVTPLLAWDQAPAPNVLLKAEALQLTGSFKVRGALAKLSALGADAPAGVICGSAGNHARGLAAAAQALGVPCHVVMPVSAPLTKIHGAESRGATVRLEGNTVEAAIAAAQAHADRDGLTFVHPYDDLDVIAGQATIGLELLDQAPRISKVIVPMGGGGLISGLAAVIKARFPNVEIVGVTTRGPSRSRSDRGAWPGISLADGIAVKRPGRLTQPLIDHLASDVVSVDDDEIAEAMIVLSEGTKLVVEGAGAAGAAALLGGHTAPAEDGETVVLVSGGNVDISVMAAVATRHESRVGRRIVITTQLADRPGALAHLLHEISDLGANLLDVAHVRDGLDLHIRETAVQLTLEIRGPDHGTSIIRALRGDGYAVKND